MDLNSRDAVIVINGVEYPLRAVSDRLSRAVIISLFTWRRAGPDDPYPGAHPMGWWGDTWPTVANDRIGSRLWLLAREVITAPVIERARGYILEALQWMCDDGVATEIRCTVTRFGLNGVAATVDIIRVGGGQLSLRFDDFWSMISHG